MIKRRTLVRSLPVSVASSVAVLAEHRRGLPTLAEESRQPLADLRHHTYKWALLYWMPYDNDLARFGDSILGMLTRGTRDSDVVVAVQSDMREESTMQRHCMVDGVMTRVAPDAANTDPVGLHNSRQENTAQDKALGNELDELLGEDSSNSGTLSDYLQWAQATFNAEHWAVIVVGHGDRINQVSQDNHSPVNKLGDLQHPHTWMGIDALGQSIGQFNQSLQDAEQGQVDLLFFQNCNKATLEVLYEVHHCAQYTLASQFALGAPNYYYEEVLSRLGQASEVHSQDSTQASSPASSPEVITDGYGAALAIMTAEAQSMYQTLTLVDNRAIAQLPTYLTPLLQILKDSPVAINALDLPTYRYFGERHCDLLALLEQLVETSGQGTDDLRAFTDFMTSSVISHCATEGHLYGSGALMRSQPDRFCGIGMYCPANRFEGDRYRSMALAQAVDLQSLYKKIA